jgi:hypothetical protein
MNVTMMLFLDDFAMPIDAGPATPRPADPSPEGGEAEPVGDDDADDERDRERDRDASDDGPSCPG